MRQRLAALGLAVSLLFAGGLATAPAALAEGPHTKPACKRVGQLHAGAYRIDILENPRLNVQRQIYVNKFTHKRHTHLVKCSFEFYLRTR